MSWIVLEAATEPFISVNVWTDILTIVNLLILCLILKHFLYKPVKEMLNKRRQEVEDTYRRAGEAEAAAQQTKAQYEAQMANAKQEANALMQEASRRAQSRSEEIVAEAKQNAAHIVQKAEERIETEEKQARSKMKQEISGVAFAAAEKILQKELSPDDHRQLLDDVIGDLEKE